MARPEMTRLAFISDQHGNDVAFAAAIRDIDRFAVDELVCLGDVAQGGAEPRQTLDRLQSLGCRTVCGNADAFLFEGAADSGEPVTERQLRVREWTLSRLDSAHLEFMRSFEPRIELEVEGASILCFHGSPQGFDDVLLPEPDGGPLAPFLTSPSVDLLVGGHTHRQWTRRIGGSLFINPGSVGLPDRGLPAEVRIPLIAEYALVNIDESGISVEFRHPPYSYGQLERHIAESGHPYAQDLIEQLQQVT